MSTPNITFSGMATGLDTNALISGLMKVERYPVQRLEQKKAIYNAKSNKLNTLKMRLGTLKGNVDSLDTRDEVLTRKASSSDESVFTVSTTGVPSLGSSSLTVSALAQSETTYSNTFSSSSTAGLFGDGTLSIQVGSEAAIDVTVDPTDTLEKVVSSIESAVSNVDASVIYDGTNYRIRVTGNDTGVSNSITFTESAGLSLGLDEPSNELVAAQDAAFTIDGISMTRSSNTVTNAIPGVSISLLGTTTSAVSMSVTTDTTSTENRLRAMVDNYNAVMTTITSESAMTAGVTKNLASLSGDSSLRSIQSSLRNVIATTPTGLSGDYQTLASIGVQSNSDGSLKLDTTILSSAIAADPDGVAKLLAGDSDAGITGLTETLADTIDGFIESGTGLLPMRIDSFEGRMRAIDDQIAKLELRLQDKEASLRKQYASLEQVVSGLQNQGNQMIAAMGGVPSIGGNK